MWQTKLLFLLQKKLPPHRLLIYIILLNIVLRTVFIFYGYITHDEGIALYNIRLAHSGLIPFIDYNAWNSLLNDYIMGITYLFSSPTFLNQRLLAGFLALCTFLITISSVNRLAGRVAVVWTAFFLTFGSLTYTYYSNLPYSVEPMTLALSISLYFLITSQSGPHRQLKEDLVLFFVILATIIRSQALPIVGVVLLYLIIRHRYQRRYSLLMIGLTFLVSATFYLPFLWLSYKHALYALFWPFFAGKILLYVADIPVRNITLLSNFVIIAARDYGVLIFLCVTGFFLIPKNLKRESERIILLTLLILGIFFLTAIVHHPSDPWYLYPVVPIMSLAAGYYVTTAGELIKNRQALYFLISAIVGFILIQAITYPHFKLMQTSLGSLTATPYSRLRALTDYITTNSSQNDELITFYLPAVAATSRRIPLTLSEGPGSISVLDEEAANYFHLASIPNFQQMIQKRQAKLIIFSDTSLYYFGRTETQRQQTLELIKQNYDLVKEFSDLSSIDGSKAKSLMIFTRLPD